MPLPPDIHLLEARLGHVFRDRGLIAEALTHPSWAYESRRAGADNQRLEFLGDAVLQLVLTEHLYLSYPDLSEGQLTKRRVRLVSRDALHAFATELGLGDFLVLGRGEESNGGRRRASILADAFEAVVGAVYRDGGLEAAARFVLGACRSGLDDIDRQPDGHNPKGELQELLQGPGGPSPGYAIVSESGPDHAKQFAAEVRWQGCVLGRGDGATKKEAEIRAAEDALRHRRWEAPGGPASTESY